MAAFDRFAAAIDAESRSASKGPISAQCDPPATMSAVMSCESKVVEFFVTPLQYERNVSASVGVSGSHAEVDNSMDTAIHFR